MPVAAHAGQTCDRSEPREAAVRQQLDMAVKTIDRLNADGAEVQDSDPVPVVGPQDVKVGSPDQQNCHIPVPGEDKGICTDIDFMDPTFDGPIGSLNWEEIAGPNGGVVTRWATKNHTAGGA